MASEITITPDDVKRLKGRGFLRNKKTSCFSARVVTPCGHLSSAQLHLLADLAEKYGNGEVVMTTRFSAEMPGIAFDRLDAFEAELKGSGLSVGGTGPKVRPVVSCKGTVCGYGRIDTFALAQKIQERFYDGGRERVLPHKFKIAVGGCPNNCVKPTLNDLGIIGAIAPPDASGARSFACNIYIGGRWGKKTGEGQMLPKVFTSEEEVLDTIEKVISAYEKHGNPGERFADTITRVGFEKICECVIGDGSF